MNLSYNWLGDYVNHGLTPEELAALLTMTGLEVDDVTPTGAALDGVVVGRVLAAEPHPDADRLRVCTVQLAEGEDPVQIVCGAPNVAADQLVPVATVGTVLMLPGKDGTPAEVTIKKGKIRGQVSNGMICAEDELGLGSDHDGILVLSDHARLGEPISDYLARTGAADFTIDVSLTPNRPDATGHIGVARDIAALTGKPLVLPEVALPQPGGAAADLVQVAISAPDVASRFVCFALEGVQVGPSPDWLRQRLEAIGLRPISNVVDVTNYVMHATGQPMHAYDLDRVQGTLRIDRASGDETLTTLDDHKRTLPAGAAVIRDDSGPIGMGGIMGGASTEVSDATTRIALEVAYFDPSTIRRAAKTLGLSTDASYRFERGVDPTGQAFAGAWAASLIAELAGGTVAEGYAEVQTEPFEPTVVTLRPERMRALVGADIETDEALGLLEAIGFERADRDTGSALSTFAEGLMAGADALEAAEDATDGIRLRVPAWRPDTTREVDVIEEVVRLWGFDRVPFPPQITIPTTSPLPNPVPVVRRNGRDALVGLGYREVYANSMLSAEVAQAFVPLHPAFGRDGEAVATRNPISQEMAVLRPSLLPGVLAIAAHNQRNGAPDLRLFEIGTAMRKTEPHGGQPVAGYSEREHLLLFQTGHAQTAEWSAPARRADFFDLKGAVLRLLASLGLSDVREEAVYEPASFADYRLDLKVHRKAVGFVAPVPARHLSQFDVSGPAFYAELAWDTIAEIAVRSLAPTFEPFSRFPAVDRDLAFVVERGVQAGDVATTIRQRGGKLLQDVHLFDVYEGDRIAADRKSLAFALRFSADRTLRDADIDKAVSGIVRGVEQQHGAELRA
jgi:phenylalanyl-tRNA synthetase beta chain